MTSPQEVVFLLNVDNMLHTDCGVAMLVGYPTMARSSGRDERNPS